MSDSPLVSVVMPAYNAQKTIARAIESALTQTVSDLEVVVVDDGSSDATVAIVKGIDDPRVRIVEQPNGGAAAARNTGILESRGRWIAFLDADDLFLPEKLERQLALLDSRPDVRAVQTGVLEIDDDERVIGERRCQPSVDSLLETLRFQNLPGIMSTLVVARDDLVQFGMFDTSLFILEEWDMAIKVSRHSNMQSIPEPLALYRQHEGNRSANLDIHVAPGFAVLDRVFADPDLPAHVRAQRRDIYGRFYTMLAGASLRVHRWPDLVKWSAKALRTDPRRIAYMAALPVRRVRRAARRRVGDEVTARPCPACGSSIAVAMGEEHGHAWCRCRTCDTCFTAALPTAAELDEVYSSYYGGAPPDAPPVVVEVLADLVRTCEPQRSLNRFLDVGYGGGDLLRAADAAGWDCWGTEVADDSLAAGRAAGWSVIEGDLVDVDLQPGSFDVLAFVEVLEHLPDPTAYLRRAFELLRPGGVVIGTTPNGESINRRVLGLDWTIARAPEHLQLFSADGMRRVFARAGFPRVDVFSSGLNPSELVGKVRRRPVAGGMERVESAHALNERLTSSARGRLTKRSANAVLARTGIGDTLKLRALRP